VTGTLGAGAFGGGVNSSINNFGLREDIDLQLLWQLDNLGFGNRARVQERKAENRLALVELFRVQDRVAAEVAQAQLAAARVDVMERGVRLAEESAAKNLVGLSQTRGAGGLIQLIVRPQEVVAAIQTLAQAYADHYSAVADSNRGQFRLYRAMGQPGQALLDDPHCAGPAVAPVPPPAPDPPLQPLHPGGPLPPTPDLPPPRGLDPKSR
jgi:hypothetical protein